MGLTPEGLHSLPCGSGLFKPTVDVKGWIGVLAQDSTQISDRVLRGHGRAIYIVDAVEVIYREMDAFV